MTASANYGVSIAEDFTPPENWIPGQEIEKNVSVVNTGNVDAFVRVWLEGEFNLVKEGAGLAYASAGTPAAITDNARLAALGFEKIGTSYVKVLSKDQTINPANSNVTTNSSTAYSEVQALQAGGYLASAPSNAVYRYTLNQNKAVDVYYDAINNAVTDIVSGSTVIVDNTATAPASNVYHAPYTAYGDVDADTFMPTTTGLYLFRRNVDVNNVQTDKDWEYSGYYYITSGEEDGTWAKQGKYYALKTKVDSNDDTVYVDGIAYNDGGTVVTWYVDQQTGAITDASALANVKLFTAEESTVQDDSITWAYTAATTSPAAPAKLTASVHTAGGNTQADLISIDVTLANIDGSASPNESWQYVAATSGHRATFYYKNDVEQGDTTAKLVDAVTLSSATKQTAYIAFDFDLNVNMDSIQVTVDADENENFDSVKPWASSSKAVAQQATVTAGKEIDTITWANPT